MMTFKGKDVMSDDSIEMETRKASIIRLSEEMTELAAQLLQKASALQEEIRHGRGDGTG